jgi:hypothetical protein
MLNYDQGKVCLFQDGHKLEGGKLSSYLQLHEPAMQPTQDAREVASHNETLEKVWFYSKSRATFRDNIDI